MGRHPDHPFLQIDIGLTTTREFLAFAAEVREGLPADLKPAWIAVAFLHLTKTWEAFLTHAPDGFPAEIRAEIVEEWAGFRGVSGVYFHAFVRAWCEHDGERLVLRGWHKRYGKIAARRKQDVERKRLARQKGAASASAIDLFPEEFPAEILDEPVDFQRKSDGYRPDFDTRVKSKEELLTPSPDGDGGPPAHAVAVDADALARHGSVSALVLHELPSATAALDRAVLQSGGTAVALMPAPAPAKRARSGQAPQFPHFTPAHKEQLIGVWTKHLCPIIGAEIGRFTKAFGRWFLEPESERSPEQPTDAEIATALEEMLVAKKHSDGGDKLAVFEYAAERIGLVVQVLRETTDNVARAELIDRRLGLRPRRTHQAFSSR